jgi:hypothetical protein
MSQDVTRRFPFSSVIAIAKGGVRPLIASNRPRLAAPRAQRSE